MSNKLRQITREQAAQLWELGVKISWAPYGAVNYRAEILPWSTTVSPAFPGLGILDTDTFFVQEE